MGAEAWARPRRLQVVPPAPSPGAVRLRPRVARPPLRAPHTSLPPPKRPWEHRKGRGPGTPLSWDGVMVVLLPAACGMLGSPCLRNRLPYSRGHIRGRTAGNRDSGPPPPLGPTRVVQGGGMHRAWGIRGWAPPRPRREALLGLPLAAESRSSGLRRAKDRAAKPSLVRQACTGALRALLCRQTRRLASIALARPRRGWQEP